MRARTVRTILLNLAVGLIALLVLFPLAWMLSVSFMSTGEAAVFPPPLLPKTWTLDHYRDLFLTQGMGRYLWNSFALASLATGLALAFTVPA
ncbi:MAG: carbohydrate ABC transporter permease, partial [Brevundimonas sp.]|nr:carbohydrate ABC transporter permease [Brevundimonas sp.]